MPEDFKKILTLIDFSSSSLHAADEAALIASKFNSQLHLLHVSPYSNPSYLLVPEVYFLKIAGNVKKSEELNIDKLRKIKEDLESRFGIDVEIHETQGKLCETVSKYVHDLNTDLIVLGANRKN